jgi:biotin carboxyl carrier protein
MPGTINAVKVKVGDSVSKGQVLVVLEAMKMENEIMAETDGTVASVAVSQGQTVNTGDVLVTLN